MRPLSLQFPRDLTPEVVAKWAVTALREVELASHQLDDRMSLVAVLKVLGLIPYIDTVSTTDATVTTLATIPADVDTTMLIDGIVVGRRTGGSSGTDEDGAGYVLRAAVTNIAGTATIISQAADFTSEDQAGWAATFVASGSDILVRVTGAANNNVNWRFVGRVVKQGD